MSVLRIIDTINASFATFILLYSISVAIKIQKINIFILLFFYMAMILLASVLVCYYYSHFLLVLNDIRQT